MKSFRHTGAIQARLEMVVKMTQVVESALDEHRLTTSILLRRRGAATYSKLGVSSHIQISYYVFLFLATLTFLWILQESMIIS